MLRLVVRKVEASSLEINVVFTVFFALRYLKDFALKYLQKDRTNTGFP